MIIIGALGFFTIGNSYDEYNAQKDTIILTVPDYNIIKQNDSLCIINDSLQTLIIKYEEELNIALFKIDRIKEYNRIAGSGNNIKYLRGWINRVFDE